MVGGHPPEDDVDRSITKPRFHKSVFHRQWTMNNNLTEGSLVSDCPTEAYFQLKIVSDGYTDDGLGRKLNT